MADITMCRGLNCPLKESCYRHTANRNLIWQSYFMNEPIKDGKCDMYWNNELNNKTNDTKEESTRTS